VTLRLGVIHAMEGRYHASIARSEYDRFRMCGNGYASSFSARAGNENDLLDFPCAEVDLNGESHGQRTD
jgi:hypothetical protein